MPYKTVVIALSAILTTTSALADIVGTQSDDANIEVGTSNVPFGPHTMGKAGIGNDNRVSSTFKVDFEGLTRASSTQKQGDIYTNGTSHAGDAGVFNFAQAGAGDVWFGEWSQDFAGNGQDRSVYYAGDNTQTSLPTSGTASYAVTGLNRFTGNNALTGEFNADFSAKTVRGTISNAAMKLSIDAGIDAKTAAFEGKAVALHGGQGVKGATQGHFFGADAAALAGIATFADRDLNTAFGGTKK